MVGENNGIDVVGALLLLSQGGEETGRKREFGCKTCSRRFPSFQALGGHRASHKKPRPSEGVNQDAVPGSKAKVHACPVCGLGFAVGQALGGHMRKHRSANEALGAKKPDVGEQVLDLNLPASDDVKRREMGLELRLGLGFVD